jgi:hypothetical protein
MPTHEELVLGVVNLEKRVAKLDEWAATVKHHGDQIDGLLGDIERNRKLVARVEALEKDAAATVRNRCACAASRAPRAARGVLVKLEKALAKGGA